MLGSLPRSLESFAETDNYSFAALGPGSLFGLATFSHKVGLYDVQGPIPVVKNVFIPPDLDGSLPMELEDVMPLSSFLAPVRCFTFTLEWFFHFKGQLAGFRVV